MYENLELLKDLHQVICSSVCYTFRLANSSKKNVFDIENEKWCEDKHNDKKILNLEDNIQEPILIIIVKIKVFHVEIPI